jgi:predicted SAM-dependent methyltransferase
MKKSTITLMEIVKIVARPIKGFLKRILYYGNRRYCPVCERSSRKFFPFGEIERKDAQCPYCRSLERHRFVWYYFSKKTSLLDGTMKRVLHFAPEKCLETRLRGAIGSNYVTADLMDTSVNVITDIMNMGFADESFDVIYCSHVLEHVIDDLAAIRELYRVLRLNGWAIILLPLSQSLDKTFEDPSITDPELRLKYFGQHDHLRLYGRDFIERLSNIFDDIKIIYVSDLLFNEEAIRMGLSSEKTGEIYYCTKC